MNGCPQSRLGSSVPAPLATFTIWNAWTGPLTQQTR